MSFRPVHDADQLIPILNFFKRHVFDGGAGDDKTVILLIADIVKCFVECEQVVFGGVF